MRILTVEDEPIAREGMIKLLNEIRPEAEVRAFESSEEALECIKDESFGIALLDIQMDGVSGLDFAVLLKHYIPAVKVIFTTGYSQYAADAFAVHADGYIIKPVTKKKLEKELDRLFENGEKMNYSTVQPEAVRSLMEDPGIRIQTFGNFEIFVDGIPAHFKYTLTKEMLAYLIDRRGAQCTNGELISILWEDASYNRISYLKNLKSDLKNTLSEAGCEDILIQRKGSIGVLPQKIKCDFYDFMNGEEEAVRQFRGEYMSQYSWAENTLSFLNRMAGEFLRQN